MNDPYVIKMEKFEGPLDLLLQLIEQEKLPITEISLVSVTDQYIGYLKTFEKRSPEILADFLVIAAKLLVIKSRALLPFLQVNDEEVESDIRELEERLKLYQRFKGLAQAVGQLWDGPAQSYEREFQEPHLDIFMPPKNLSVAVLNEAIGRILRYMSRPQDLQESVKAKLEKTIRLEEKIKFIQNYFQKVNRLQLSDLLKDSKTRAEIVVTFLALLELIKQNIIAFHQAEVFGEAVFEPRLVATAPEREGE